MFIIIVLLLLFLLFLFTKISVLDVYALFFIYIYSYSDKRPEKNSHCQNQLRPIYSFYCEHNAHNLQFTMYTSARTHTHSTQHTDDLRCESFTFLSIIERQSITKQYKFINYLCVAIKLYAVRHTVSTNERKKNQVLSLSHSLHPLYCLFEILYDWLVFTQFYFFYISLLIILLLHINSFTSTSSSSPPSPLLLLLLLLPTNNLYNV